MIFLEIAMIVIGLGAILYSLRMSSNPGTGHDTEEKLSEEDSQKEAMRLQAMLDSFTSKAETICDNLEDKLSQMSNEKILGMNEYSEQVLEKMEKNHEEIVFLYDMMNEKQEEIKNLVHDIDTRKAELHNETAAEYQQMKEQEKLLDEMKKELEVDLLQYQTEQGKYQEAFEKWKKDFEHLKEEISGSVGKLPADTVQKAPETVPDSDFDLEKSIITGEPDEPDDFDALLGGGQKEAWPVQEPAKTEDTFDTSVFDAEIARIEAEETKAGDEEPVPASAPSGRTESNYQPLSEQTAAENHNDEIISLYKKGRSVLEISKMLALGQGEVKFVIDLYNAR